MLLEKLEFFVFDEPVNAFDQYSLYLVQIYKNQYPGIKIQGCGTKDVAKYILIYM